MHEILILVTAILFYGLGRVAGYEAQTYKSVKNKLKNTDVLPGVIKFPTQQELEYKGSEQEKIDQEQTRLARDAGLDV